MVMSIVILLILFFGVGFSFRESRVNGKYNATLRKSYVLIVSFILILQSGLRNVAVGADTYAYYKTFYERLSWSWSEILINFKTVYIDGVGKDAGYYLFQKIFQSISHDYRLFLFVVAIIFFYALGRFLLRNTNNVLQLTFAYILYLALFYEFFSITGIRQTLATSIILFGFEYVKDKKIWKYLICCAIAFIFHKSSILCVLIYPFFWYKNIRLVYTCVVVACAIILVFSKQIMQYTYLMYYDKEMSVNELTLPFTYTLFILMIFALVVINLKKLIKNKGNAKLLGLCNILALGFTFVPLVGIDSMMTRITQYSFIFMTITVPSLFNITTIIPRRLCYILGIVMLIVVIAMKNYEYAFFWEPMRLGGNYGFGRIMIE